MCIAEGFRCIIREKSGKKYLSFQRNVSGKRYVGRTFINEGEIVEDVLVRLKENIKKRYELDGDNGIVW